MGALLKLYTFLSELTFIEAESGVEGRPLKKATYELKNGTTIHIFDSHDEEEGQSYIIAGGYIFREFKTIEACERLFLDLQKNADLIYGDDDDEF